MALIASQAGYQVSGSDSATSSYIDYLKAHGIPDIHIGQTAQQIADVNTNNTIDWFVYSVALPMTHPDHAELKFCEEQGIKSSNRSEFTSQFIKDKNLEMIAIAGTHGKSTVTAMTVWAFGQLNLPISYLVGAKLNFAQNAHFDPASQLFVYEADEYHRNFLNYQPKVSLITGLDWDHADIYPTRQDYNQAFSQFIDQSQHIVMWARDAKMLSVEPTGKRLIINQDDPQIDQLIKLAGHVNRLDAWLAAKAVHKITGKPLEEVIEVLNKFPGLSRRFEQIVPGMYSDYAHTPPKIRGALQLASEVGGNNVVVVYEGLHNTRQHFIKGELAHIFDDIKQLYIVPSYLAREDKDLKLLSPADLLDMLSNKSQSHTVAAQLDKKLREAIIDHIDSGDLVLCLTAGGSGSLDEWLRKEFTK